MNIENMVRGIMTKATKRFAQQEQVKDNEISIVIHTKNEGYLPQYYYMVKNAPKKNEDGTTKELSFKKDILNAKLDLLNQEGIAAEFLKNKFFMYEEVYSEQGVSAKNLYLMIHPKNEQASDFDVYLLHQRSLLKKLTLGEIFDLQ